MEFVLLFVLDYSIDPNTTREPRAEGEREGGQHYAKSLFTFVMPPRHRLSQLG